MVTVNGEPWLEFMCTPEYLEALAVGFLYNEGLIESAVQLADNWSMTLIGYAHDERFKVYAHLERIEAR